VPDYSAVNIPGNRISLVASGAVVGGDPLEVAGNGTVQKCATVGSPKYVGIAAHDAASGGRVTVTACAPIFDGPADGTVTAGDQVTPSTVAARQVKTLPVSAIDTGSTFIQATVNAAINAGLNAARGFCGVALTTATDGNTVRWIQK